MRGLGALVFVSGFGSAIVGCAAWDDEGREALSCAEGDVEISTELGRRFVGTACAADSECTSELATVSCPDDGARFSWCAHAVHVDDVGRWRETLDGVLADVCPRIPPECRGGASCAATVPACVDGRCMQIDRVQRCIDVCNACEVLSTCEGHCTARAECILAAETCDGVVDCVSGPTPPDAGTT